jgi:hypothetical protein
LDKESLSKALQPRLDEVVDDRLSHIDLSGEDAAFADKVKGRLRKGIFDWQCVPGVEDVWFTSNADCLTFIRDICVCSVIAVAAGQPPLIKSFIDSLLDSARDPQRRSELLLERYICPLNISFTTEESVREHILMRTMVHDRATVERNSFASVDSDDLLLRLNLIAIHAGTTSDLRFLDSLNYYYELLPERPAMNGRHKWLWVSFLVLYARALAAHV